MTDNGIRPTMILSIDQLRPHPRNYQSHPSAQIDHLVRSIELHGIFRNIVVARGNVILAGHGVVLALQRLGWERVPVVLLDVDPLSAPALHVLAADNEISNLAEVDDRALTELLRDLADPDIDLLFGTGYDDEQLMALLLATRTRAELPDIDAAAEWVGLPSYEQPPIEPQLLVHFDSAADRDALMDKLGVDRPNHRAQANDRWSIWWPPRERADLRSIRFEP